MSSTPTIDFQGFSLAVSFREGTKSDALEIKVISGICTFIHVFLNTMEMRIRVYPCEKHQKNWGMDTIDDGPWKTRLLSQVISGISKPHRGDVMVPCSGNKRRLVPFWMNS